MLEYLRLENVGPAPSMEMEFADRINLLTGDNSLGKSFLLDCAWWALTQKWPQELNSNLTSGYKAMPRDPTKAAAIGFRVQSKTKPVEFTSKYARKDQRWPSKQGRPVNPGLVIYAQADGGFSVWDPARNYWKTRGGHVEYDTIPAFVFTAHEVWWGRDMDFKGKVTKLCRGLVEDWAIWIREKGATAEAMEQTLQLLAAPGEKIRMGPLQRLDVNDTRDIPSINTAYSEGVRVVHASAGMRRIMGLAYMLLWSYDEHTRSAALLGDKPTHQVTMIFDELESHLHPRWQRSILRSVLDVAKLLHKQATVQLIAVTHSPMVLASAEPYFDDAQDAWFDLDLERDSGIVALRRRPFVRHGDASRWLTSQAFDLEEARSIPAEDAIREARAFAKRSRRTLAEAKAIDAKLRKAGLPDIDPFWVRWSFMMDELKERA
jgi:hypothetical protein